MDEVIQFLLRHGYTLLFLFVFAEQIGLPLPAIPILLAMGAANFLSTGIAAGRRRFLAQ
jgi:membrane protein DedA with SNARE-associated domain